MVHGVFHDFAYGQDSRLLVRREGDEWTGVHGVKLGGHGSRYGGFLAWEGRLGLVCILDLDLTKHAVSIRDGRLHRQCLHGHDADYSVRLRQ